MFWCVLGVPWFSQNWYKDEGKSSWNCPKTWLTWDDIAAKMTGKPWISYVDDPRVETVINIAIFWKTTPFSDTSSWLDPFYNICFVWLRNKYPPDKPGMVCWKITHVKVGWISQRKKTSILLGDFPASHVWLPKGNDYKTHGILVKPRPSIPIHHPKCGVEKHELCDITFITWQ